MNLSQNGAGPDQDQIWGWWIKGLGGLINIGQQLAERFGGPRGLDSEVNRLQVLAGARYTVSEQLVLTDHRLKRMSWDGGSTWVDGVIGS